MVVEDAAADPVAGLDAQDVQPLPEQVAGRDEPGDAGAHDDDVDLPGQPALTPAAATGAGLGRPGRQQQPARRGGGPEGAGGEQVPTRQRGTPRRGQG